jgi:preprotein translocase subunit SecG
LGAWETAAAMELIVLSIHLLVCICLIGLVLLQRSEGGALGMGGGGGSSLMTGRGAADALAKMTSVAGGFFLVTSLGLTMLSGAGDANAGRSVLDPEQSAPMTPAAPAPAAPQTTPEEARPDPTESRAPSNTQLVSIGPREAAASTPSAPAPSSATTRAGPIDQRATTTAATTPRQTPASTTQRAATTPATTQRTAAQPPAATRSTPATTQPAATQTPARTVPAPANTAVTGIDLTTDPQIGNESSDTGSVVRRERAGPDQ